MHYTQLNSPLGSILIAADTAHLKGLWFEGQKYEPDNLDGWISNPDNPVLTNTAAQLHRYFAGQFNQSATGAFNVNIAPNGTPFQQQVWQGLLTIPRGQTITYGELASQLGKPSAVRAVAAAIGKNPISVIIPCHRVVGANGSLTGYAGGLARKQSLLELEQSDH